MLDDNKNSLSELSDELWTYLNWSVNALAPTSGNRADNYLKVNKATIVNTSQKLLREINYTPTEIYRGLLLREKSEYILPHKNLEYLSFSENIEVVKQFADIHGFGSNIVDLKTRLGEFGYVIHYTPQIEEIIFHYKFLDLLPYSEALNLIGMNGDIEVASLKEQMEVTILQPNEPFYNIHFQNEAYPL